MEAEMGVQPHTYDKVLYKFETRTLFELDNLIKTNTYDVFSPEYAAIKKLQENALKMARTFDEVMTDEYMKKYLDDGLEIGCLIPLSKAVSRSSETFSKSHQEWLDELRRTKLTWDRRNEQEKKREKFDNLKNSFITLQRLAYKYVPVS